MLGRAASELLLQNQAEVIETDLEVDITREEEVSRFAAETRPDCVLNCAAYTRVDDAEKDEARARQVNALGPAHLAAAARAQGADLVHISTDYVFDGQGAHPYGEEEPPRPLGVYGRTKHEGEQRVLELAEPPASTRKTYILRTAWLFGEHGPNFVTTMLGLMRERETLRVVCDQHGCPTYTRDLAAAIWSLYSLRAPGGVYHFTNAEPTTWHGFATMILELARAHGLPVQTQTIEAIATREYPRPAPRPAYSVLSTARYTAATGEPPRPWQAALREYFERTAASGGLSVG